MKTSVKNSLALLRAKTGQLVLAAGAAGSMLVSQAAHAVASASATEAVAGVTAAKDDMVLVFGGVLTLAIAVWGIYKIVKIFGGK